MDDSFTVSNIPVNNNNRAADVAHADTIKYKEVLHQRIANMSFTDDESDPEDESDSEESSVSDLPETSMLDSDPQNERQVHQNGLSCEQSPRSETRASDQHSYYEDNSEGCEGGEAHSYLTSTQGIPSECRSLSEEEPRSLAHQAKDEHVLSGVSSFLAHDHRHRDYAANGHSVSSLDEHSNIDHRTSEHVLSRNAVDQQDYQSHSVRQVNGYADSIAERDFVGNGSLKAVETSDWQEKCRASEILCENAYRELQLVKNAELTYRKDAEQQKRKLENQIYQLTDEKNEILSHLQAAQTTISDYESENKKLHDKIISLEEQLADVINERDKALSKLEGVEISVHSLEKQLRDLQRTENLSRLQDQHSRILEDLKMRHQKDILKYKESIDDLQAKLGAKIQDMEKLTEENSELHQKCKKLLKEKSDMFKDLSQQVDLYENRCQKYMKSDTMEELNLLKLQVKRLESENSYINTQNEALKDEVKSLKAELNTSEALQKLAFSNQTKKTLHEISDGKQKEYNLHSELQNSLKNVRALRSENSDLKKELKNSENQLSQMNEKIKYYESQIAESEMKSRELEEKLKYLSSNESISNSFHEKKIKSLEQELQALKINSHDMAKNLKKATNNEKILKDNIEDLQRRMGEMIQKHSEEKLQSVEECRKKYLELHEDILKKEKEKMNSKSQELSAKYEERIADLQKEIKTLSEGIYESKSQYIAVYQENQNLQMKLDKVYKSKETEEIEKEIRAEYEKQLKETKELLKKEKDEYEKYLQVKTERAQIEWTDKHMEEIKRFIEDRKRQLDEQYQSCVQKAHKDLETEKERLHKEFEEKLTSLKHQYEWENKEKLIDLKQQYEREYSKKLIELKQQYEIENRKKLVDIKQQYERESNHLSQELKSKLEKEIAALKECHKKEMNYAKHQFENKLLSMEEELKCLKDRMSLKSQELENVEKIKQECIQQQKIFEQEKSLLQASERALNENLKSLFETEKRLREKLKKFQRHTTAIKKKHADEVMNLQRQLSDIQETCNEKDNNLHSMKAQYEQYVNQLSDKVRKFHNLCRSAETQTEEEMVPKQVLLNNEHKFFQCLHNISDAVGRYLTQSRKRHAERLQETIRRYHEQLFPKILEGISNDMQSFTPTFIIPRPATTANLNSGDTMTFSENFRNGQFKTSTPGVFNSAPKPSHTTPMPFAAKSASSPNLHRQAVEKSVHFSQNADTASNRNYFSSIYKTLTPVVDAMSSGDALRMSEKASRENGVDKGSNVRKGIEPAFGFADISYDFVSMNPQSGLLEQMTNYGLFGRDNSMKTDNILKDSLPVKLTPN